MFGLFKKKKVEVDDEPTWQETQIEELKAFRDIGEKFNYMGVEIIVTHHYKIHMSIYSRSVIPILTGDYANNLGEIKAISFSHHELPNLIAENEAK